MAFMGLYSIVDGFFVANFISTDALSAVNLMMPVVIFSMAVGMMLGTGGIAVIARKLGQKREDEARENFSLILLIAFIFSVAVVIIAFIFIEPLIYSLGADEPLYPLCYKYAIAALGILPLTIFSVITQNAFIAIGKAHLSLALSVMGGVVNILLDYILIVPLKMGISGAALATAIGYAVPAIIGVAYFSIKRDGLLYIVKPKFDGKAIFKSCSNGLSKMISSLAIAITTLLFNRSMMSVAGSDGVAAITIALYLMSIMSSIYMGYSVGIAPLTSYNYGKKDRANLHQIYRISIIIIIISSILAFAISLLFTKPLVSIFTDSTSNVYGIAVNGCKLFAIGFLFMGINIYASSMFTALSSGLVSAIISVFRSLIFTVGAILILPDILGINGIWLSIPVAELMGLAISVMFFIVMRRKYNY